MAAGVEHSVILGNLSCNTVIDVGSNRGQFTLVARHSFPKAVIFAFEPLPGPSAIFDQLFSIDSATTMINSAIGCETAMATMHVSGSDDSSSLLPISSLQEELFPGTGEVGTIDVNIAPLETFLGCDDIVAPAILKIDVQGCELDVLKGCESLLQKFQWVYCECSFVELYTGQKLASDVVGWLAKRGFQVTGMYNPSYDRNGQSVQADFLFRRSI